MSVEASPSFILGPHVSPSKPRKRGELKPILNTGPAGTSAVSVDIQSPYIQATTISRPVSAQPTHVFRRNVTTNLNRMPTASSSIASTTDYPSQLLRCNQNNKNNKHNKNNHTRRPSSSYSCITRSSKYNKKIQPRNYSYSQEFSSIFSPINDTEKPEWLVSRKNGTIYEDDRTRLSQREYHKERLRPKIIKELQKCYIQAHKDETQKQEQRLRILYRFRLQRLKNTYVECVCKLRELGFSLYIVCVLCLLSDARTE